MAPNGSARLRLRGGCGSGPMALNCDQVWGEGLSTPLQIHQELPPRGRLDLWDNLFKKYGRRGDRLPFRSPAALACLIWLQLADASIAALPYV